MSGGITSEQRVEVVREVLRWLAGGWVCADDEVDLKAYAEMLAQTEVEDWAYCPLCQEVACDDGCPLYPVRDEAGLWSR